jgi:FtsZ-interacting cell division protein YlmF
MGMGGYFIVLYVNYRMSGGSFKATFQTRQEASYSQIKSGKKPRGASLVAVTGGNDSPSVLLFSPRNLEEAKEAWGKLKGGSPKQKS